MINQKQKQKQKIKKKTEQIQSLMINYLLIIRLIKNYLNIF